MQFLTNNKVIAVVVAYNPDINLLNKNIGIISNQVEKIVVVNNGYGELIIDSDYKEIVYVINNNENLGISKALNIGINYAVTNNYSYALLLDQDSTLGDDAVNIMLKGFIHDKVGVVVPRISYINGNLDKIDESNTFNYVTLAITSGSLVDLNVMKLINWKEGKIFNEDFFIDCVDFDFSLELKASGYNILKSTKAILYQRLGEMTEIKFLFFKICPTNHSELRRYYITRNRLYMWKKYFRREFQFVVKDILYSCRELLILTFFEKNRIAKFKYMKKGICDFTQNKVGKIEK